MSFSFYIQMLTFVIFPSDRTQRWRSLTDVPPSCNYEIQAAPDPGLIFSSPLPACQSQTKVRPYDPFPTFTDGSRATDLGLRGRRSMVLRNATVFLGDSAS